MSKCILGLLLLVSLLLPSCSKISQEQNVGKKYVLYLSSLETKTVNDGRSTKWVLGDRLDVLFAETGTTNFQKGMEFKVTDVESGRIEGILPEEFDPNLVYDWYLSYANADPAFPKVKMSIGIWGTEHFQTQIGNNNRNHLSGSRRFPLVGNVKGIPGTKYPTVKMKNVAAVIAFKVRNATENELTLQDIQFKAPELINGGFKVDFSDGEIRITQDKKESIARLKIQESTPIRPGETAEFYLGVKPFSYPAGDELLCVSSATAQGKTLACRIAKLLEAPIRFDQGTVTTLNLDFVPSTAPLAVNKADFETFNQGYTTGFNEDLASLDGWQTKNCAIEKLKSEYLVTMSGNSTSSGTLVSPLLAKGCGTLRFKYQFIDSSAVSFKVDVLDEKENLVWTKTISESAPVFGTEYEFSESVNVSGPFRLKFTNLCVAGANWHTDRVSLYDLSWTNVE